ncbi:MAG TPA: hypothetical protein VGI12_00930 [Vicinamibacterales bacterium]|jgi:hypothetical protein
MKSLLPAAAAILIAAMAAACASANAKGKDDAPALDVPPPPAHVVPIPPEPIVEPVGELPAPAVPPATRGTTRGARETTARPPIAAEKPEAKPGDAAKPADQGAAPETPLPAPAPVAPAPQLRTPESNGAEATVRATIDRTRGVLSNVDYGRLNKARQKAYEDARTFAQQAEDALKAGNVVFAQSVAEKAEALARELAGK